MTRLHLALLVLLAGVLAGAAAAVALPRAAPAAGAPRLDVARTAPRPRPRPGEIALDVLPGTRRIAVRAHDPAGGPDWAVQSLRGSFYLPEGVPRERVGKELFGRRSCLRLGRIVNGRFGWLDGAGTFRPASPSASEIPTRCLRGRDPRVHQRTTWVSHPTFGPAVPLAQIAWGPATGAITVRDAAGKEVDATVAGGAFLAFGPAAGKSATLDVTVIAKHGREAPLPTDDILPRREGLPGDTRVGAQAPDPEGGAPWGVAVGRLADGRWCYGNAGRVVDDRVGDIAQGIDTFFDQTELAYQCGPDHMIKPKYRVLTRTRPLSYGFSGGVPASPSPARTALRSLPTSTVFAGITRADVRTIRITAPTQTRVLRPGGPAHAFVVPFNGEFPSGRVRFDVTFTDGTVVRQSEDPSL